jgi:predicted dehydrogenase
MRRHRPDFFELVGTKAEHPCIAVVHVRPEGGHRLCRDDRRGSKTHSFDPVEQFGNETQYFSDCILCDLRPEADGEEGLRDVRVLAAVERSLETGETVTLEPLAHTRFVEGDQALKLKPAKEPREDEMISIIPQWSNGARAA